MKKVNKTVGNRFEADLCDMLFSKGFWAHNMAQKASGQPFDIIAVKNQKAVAIDCKDCARDRFELKRIEDNQHYAMQLWMSCHNGNGWFALRTSKGIYMIAYSIMHLMACGGKKSLNLQDIVSMGINFEKWSVTIC